MSGLGRNNLIDASPSFSDSQDDSDEATQESWIEWWTHLKGNEFLCEVSEEFLRDEFNLYGFSAQVQPHSNHSHLGAFLKAFFAFMSVCVIFYSCVHGLLQIPFYPYAINIILDDDPDINDQELDGQQQVHLRLDVKIFFLPCVFFVSFAIC
jgi:hypothetical protein